MMIVRLLALTALAAVLGGCALDLDESATADPDLLRFAEMTLDEDTEDRVSLVASDTSDDQVADAGATLLDTLFAPSETAAKASNSHRFGDAVAYGAIEAVCGAPRNRLGTKVMSAGGFSIYDSTPGSTGLRAHYITGFDDRCARQFSAALVLTGSAAMHEAVRYMPSNRAPYNETDTAYEAVKADFCRVRSGKPCGGRMTALDRQTTFLTAYESFGSRPRWVEILLHDGEVAAIDFKTR